MPKGVYARDTAKRYGFVGFGKTHRVTVGQEQVYEGNNRREAERTLKRWKKFASADLGRASGKEVRIETL